MFILPVVFMGIFGLAFGQEIGARNYDIGLIKDDSESYSVYKEALESVKNGSGEDEIDLFSINEYDSEADAKLAVEESDIAIYAVVPDGFFPGPGATETLQVFGQSSNPLFLETQSVLKEVTAQYLGLQTDFIEFNNISEIVYDSESAFDYLAPGLIIYGLLILIPGIAINFAELTEKKYNFRYFTSKATATQIIAGVSIYQLVLALVQVLILYFVAQMFGFEANGSLLNALVVAVPTAFFVTALGLIIGAFADKTDAASNAGTILSIVLGFFSGSFITGIGQLYTFDFLGRTFEFTDILPSRWATVAMEKVLRQGQSLSEISTELLVVTVSGIILYVLAIVIFRNRKLVARDS